MLAFQAGWPIYSSTTNWTLSSLCQGQVKWQRADAVTDISASSTWYLAGTEYVQPALELACHLSTSPFLSAVLLALHPDQGGFGSIQFSFNFRQLIASWELVADQKTAETRCARHHSNTQGRLPLPNKGNLVPFSSTWETECYEADSIPWLGGQAQLFKACPPWTAASSSIPCPFLCYLGTGLHPLRLSPV